MRTILEAKVIHSIVCLHVKIYMEFTEAPLASASLAQVHAARTFDGRQVAVKVSLLQDMRSNSATEALNNCISHDYPLN